VMNVASGLADLRLGQGRERQGGCLPLCRVAWAARRAGIVGHWPPAERDPACPGLQDPPPARLSIMKASCLQCSSQRTGNTRSECLLICCVFSPPACFKAESLVCPLSASPSISVEVPPCPLSVYPNDAPRTFATPTADLSHSAVQVDQALSLLRAAVALQNDLFYDEPAPFFYPVGETLAGVLLSLGRQAEAAEAAAVLRQVLFQWPRSALATLGLQAAVEFGPDPELATAAVQGLVEQATRLNDTVLDIAWL